MWEGNGHIGQCAWVTTKEAKSHRDEPYGESEFSSARDHGSHHPSSGGRSRLRTLDGVTVLASPHSPHTLAGGALKPPVGPTLHAHSTQFSRTSVPLFHPLGMPLTLPAS